MSANSLLAATAAPKVGQKYPKNSLFGQVSDPKSWPNGDFYCRFGHFSWMPTVEKSQADLYEALAPLEDHIDVLFRSLPVSGPSSRRPPFIQTSAQGRQ